MPHQPYFLNPKYGFWSNENYYILQDILAEKKVLENNFFEITFVGLETAVNGFYKELNSIFKSKKEIQELQKIELLIETFPHKKANK